MRVLAGRRMPILDNGEDGILQFQLYILYILFYLYASSFGSKRVGYYNTKLISTKADKLLSIIIKSTNLHLLPTDTARDIFHKICMSAI